MYRPSRTLSIHAMLGLACTLGVAAAQDLPQSVQAQINAIHADKHARTPVERKLDSHLVYLTRESAGRPAVDGVPSISSRMNLGRDGRVLVDLDCRPSAALRAAIVAGGSVVEFESAQFESVRARVAEGRHEEDRLRVGIQPFETGGGDGIRAGSRHGARIVGHERPPEAGHGRRGFVLARG